MKFLRDTMFSFLKFDENRVLNLLYKLIGTPSITGHEEQLGELILEELKAMGIDAWKQPVGRKRFNVIGSLKGSVGSPVMLFNGHMDTVSPCEGWSTDPFRPVVKNGRVYGLGACDMKAGLAAMLATVGLLRDNVKLKGNLFFSAVVDEEAMSKGAKKLLENGPKADACLISEPTHGYVTIGAVGKMNYDIRVHGKSAHAFRPEAGVNAVTDAAKIVLALHKLELPKSPEFQASLCVIKMDGGYKRYSAVVPEYCRVIVNRLLVPDEDRRQAITELEGLIKRLNLKSKVKIKIKPPYYPPYMISKEENIVKVLEKVYQEITGETLKGKYRYSTGVSDANLITNVGGIPTVVFGPTGGNVHAANEYVTIESLSRCVRIYAALTCSLLGCAQ